ncbi:MFS transporter [Nonomuraea aurantiaca]|uniref:MFS transporter n=1 Tax=Nonomuraea aurantiaca TaxID=2878562 RepID=UPI001CD9B736|nr:MFS transporter [Nonomuraea aurantiaca]MCA2230004.1 MFS transporter [Nonomuraea aurantiaca]
MSTEVGDRISSLWRDAEFMKLWIGQSLSLVGSQVTAVALPIVAVSLLHASPSEMGVLSALQKLPFVFILFVGVWADRVRRRPLLIATDFGQGVLLITIPLLYFAGQLTLAWLCVAVVIMGMLQVVFDVADHAYLPSLVRREQLPEANSKTQLSISASEVAGRGLAALLLSWFSAAGAIVVDAVTFLASAFACLLIRRPEPAPASSGEPQRVFLSIKEGVRFVWSQPLLRPTLLATSFYMFFMTGIQALYYPFALQELHIDASLIAIILTIGGPAAVAGSALAPRLVDRIGLGRMLIIAGVFGNVSYLLIPLADGSKWSAVAALAGAQLMFGVGMPLGGMVTMTVRQAVTPDHLQGRVAATFRAFGLGIAPLGALAAGFAAEPLGLRATILVCAIGILVPLVFQFCSPLIRLRGVPDVAR